MVIAKYHETEAQYCKMPCRGKTGFKFKELYQGCLGNTSAGNTGREILGNTVREIRDRPLNTGKYLKKTLLNGYFFPIKKSYEVKISKLNTYTKK